MTDTVLAFDTAFSSVSACLLQEGRVVDLRHEEMARGQAERLMPMLEEVLQAAGLGWGDLDALGVCTGPGNFTGIRISVAAARGLALSLGLPAVGVSALEAAAFGLPEPVTAVVDARRERAYVQRFPDGAPGLVALADFAPETAISGPGAALLSARTLPQPVPIAEAIARIAAQRFATETRPPAPLYIRPADAAPARDLPPVILDEA